MDSVGRIYMVPAIQIEWQILQGGKIKAESAHQTMDLLLVRLLSQNNFAF